MATTCDALFSPTVYPQHKQGLLMSANIKYPVRGEEAHVTLGYPTPFRKDLVYLPHFGDDMMDSVFRATGGDPLADERQDRLCLVMTSVIPGVWDDSFRYGRVLRDGQCHEVTYEDEASSHAFVEGARAAQCAALSVVQQNTDQRFLVLGSKLNTLSNGRCNIVMFLKFPDGCPFEMQTYLRGRDNTKARVVPRPIVTPNKVKTVGYKVHLSFLSVDDGLFDRAFALFRHVVAEDFGMHLRFIKCDRHRRTLVVCMQLLDGHAKPVDMDRLVQSVERKRNFRSAFSPYVYRRVEWEEVEL